MRCWVLQVTDDGRYAILYVSEGCLPANRLFYVDLSALNKRDDGTIDFNAYDFFQGTLPGTSKAGCLCYSCVGERCTLQHPAATRDGIRSSICICAVYLTLTF